MEQRKKLCIALIAVIFALPGTLMADGYASGYVTRMTGGGAIANVTLRLIQGGTTCQTTTSSESGYYSVFYSTGFYNVKASIYDYETVISSLIYIPQASTTTVNFQMLMSSGVISGKITDSGNAAKISGALVEALVSGSVRASVLSDSNGDYELSVYKGTYDIRVTALNFTTKSQTGLDVGAETIATANIALLKTHGSGTISGKILRSDNQGVLSGAVISASQSGIEVTQNTSDLSGSYSLTLGDGAYDLKVSAAGFSPQAKNGVTLAPGQAVTQDFSLDPVIEQKIEVKLKDTVLDLSKNEQIPIEIKLASSAEVKIDIIDHSGKVLRNLAQEVLDSGSNVINWDGRNNSNNELGSGLYFVYVKSGRTQTIQKVVILK